MAGEGRYALNGARRKEHLKFPKRIENFGGRKNPFKWGLWKKRMAERIGQGKVGERNSIQGGSSKHQGETVERQ